MAITKQAAEKAGAVVRSVWDLVIEGNELEEKAADVRWPLGPARKD